MGGKRETMGMGTKKRGRKDEKSEGKKEGKKEGGNEEEKEWKTGMKEKKRE